MLPGVTIEAASAALIEKSRTAISDGTGQCRFTELPPGTYTLTFTLSRFSVVKRGDVEVRGSGVIPINAELRLGALQETITVTGESPIVDTQSTRREMVLTNHAVALCAGSMDAGPADGPGSVATIAPGAAARRTVSG